MCVSVCIFCLNVRSSAPPKSWSAYVRIPNVRMLRLSRHVIKVCMRSYYTYIYVPHFVCRTDGYGSEANQKSTGELRTFFPLFPLFIRLSWARVHTRATPQ